MVVDVFLSGPPLNPQILSTHLCFASFGQFPLCDASLNLCSVLGCGGQFGLCHPITVQGTGSLGCPFFCLGSLWVVLQARRAPPANPGPGNQAESAAQRLQVSQDRMRPLGALSDTELLAGTGGRWQGEKPSRNPLSP